VAGYVLRRLAWVIVALLLVSGVTFLVFYLLPTSDPAVLRAGRGASPERIAEVRDALRLDEAWYAQFWQFLKDLVLHFDFGYSYQTNTPVREQIADRLPATVSLAGGAAVIALVAGIAVGTLSAVKRRSWLDRLAMGSALIAVSAPVYWLGLVALYLFSKDIGQVEIFEGAGSYTGITDDPWQWFQSLLLPWLVLAASFAAIYARLLRGSMLEALGEDYVRTARAKGLRERRVVGRHALHGAITPLVSVAGVDLGVLLGGAILTESVFDIPGVGLLAYDAILAGDLPLIQGTVLVGGLFIVVTSLLVDLAYAFIDPRVRYA
jgi:peptide/nickel transport system permease protein